MGSSIRNYGWGIDVDVEEGGQAALKQWDFSDFRIRF